MKSPGRETHSDELKMNARLTLRYRIGTIDEPPAYECGEAIWTLEDHEEAVLLQSLCDRHGVGLERVETWESVGPTTRSGVIAVVGMQLAPHGRWYAHATTREIAQFATIDELRSSPHAWDLLLVEDSCVDEVLLELLVARSAALGSMPGLLCPTQQEARAALIAKAFHAVIPRRGPYETTEIYAGLSLGRVPIGHREIFGKDASAAEIQASLRAGKDLALFKGHSDGVDASLSDRAYLCDIRRRHAYRNAPDKPRCIDTGSCHRLGMPIANAAKSPSILGIEDIAARVLVWSPCWGMGPPPHTSSVFGLGLRLGASPSVGAVLTTVGGALQHHTLFRGLLEDLQLGRPAGVAAHRHNGSEIAAQLDHCLIVLGDPRCACFPAELHAGSEPFVPTMSIHEQCAFLNLIAREVFTGEDLDSQVAATAFTGRLSEGEQMEEAALVSFQQWLLGSLARVEPAFVINWMAVATMLAAPLDRPRCSMCGNESLVSRFTGRFDHPLLAERTVLRCPRCGFSSDSPRDGRIAASLDPSGFSLHGTARTGPISAVAVGVTHDDEKVVERWPDPQFGAGTSATLRPDFLDDPNVIDVFILVADGLDLYMFHGYSGEPRNRERRQLETPLRRLGRAVAAMPDRA